MQEQDWAKIPLVAKDLGVSVKTIYNWVNDGKLHMPQSGYISKSDAYEVWIEQQNLRSIYSYFMAVKGIKRDTNGRFEKKSL
jgi:predicted DNA-binding transcriptional regulator AlpA